MRGWGGGEGRTRDIISEISIESSRLLAAPIYFALCGNDKIANKTLLFFEPSESEAFTIS